jgi:hypothetical protein
MSSVLIGIGTWLAIPAINAQQEERTTTGAKLRDLLTAKRDVLKERFDYIKANHDLGTVPYDKVLLAHELFLKTELELASTKEQRLDICKKRIENYRFLEDRAMAEVQSGRGTSDETLLATANRIQAEIDCLREESKPI